MSKEIQERKKYTNAMIKKLAPKNQKYYVLDSEVIGLRIYVQISGDKSFYLQRYVKQFKYSKKTKIGDYPELSIAAARKLAAEIKADNVKGIDPIIAAAERAKEKTFGEVLDEYVEKRLVNKKDKSKLKNEKGNIDCWLLAKTHDPQILKLWKSNRDDLNLKQKRLTAISQEDIIDFHKAVSNKSEYTANRMIAFIRKFFNYAKGRSYFSGENPAANFKDNFNDEIQDHTDYYSTDAMNKIIAAGLKLAKNGEKRVAALGVVAALLCGGRPPSEVFNLTTDMIDLKNKVIHYKKTKTKQWSRPITPRMVQHLQYIWDLRSNGDEYMYYSKDDLRHKYLFPNIRYGQMRRGKKGLRPCKLLHIKEVRKVWKEIKAMAGVEDRDLKSLRHTFAVFCVTQNIGLRVIQKYLGHKKIETTMIYAAATDSYVNSESEKTTAGYAA